VELERIPFDEQGLYGWPGNTAVHAQMPPMRFGRRLQIWQDKTRATAFLVPHLQTAIHRLQTEAGDCGTSGLQDMRAENACLRPGSGGRKVQMFGVSAVQELPQNHKGA